MDRKQLSECVLPPQAYESHPCAPETRKAVSRFAAAIAHDFNNLLTVVIGYSDMLRHDLSGQEAAYRQVLEIRSAGLRAAALGQRLLAISQRQVLQPETLDLNAVVWNSAGTVRRGTEDRIELVVDCEPGLWPVSADPRQILDAVTNLAWNARNAMPEGGTLTIATANLAPVSGDARAGETPPRRYVIIAVGDTGPGMSNSERAHVFEPFIAMHPTGAGSGLELACVQGIVEQSGGSVHCESEPGRGTVFTILLPADAGPPAKTTRTNPGENGYAAHDGLPLCPDGT